MRSDEEPPPAADSFTAYTAHYGTADGELAHLSEISARIVDDDASGEERFLYLRARAAEHQRSLDNYLLVVRASGGDTTDGGVLAAATGLHRSLISLAIAHTRYAGTGFPRSLDEPPAPEPAEYYDESDAEQSELNSRPPLAEYTVVVPLHLVVADEHWGSIRVRDARVYLGGVVLTIEQYRFRDGEAPESWMRTSSNFSRTRSPTSLALSHPAESHAWFVGGSQNGGNLTLFRSDDYWIEGPVTTEGIVATLHLDGPDTREFALHIDGPVLLAAQACVRRAAPRDAAL